MRKLKEAPKIDTVTVGLYLILVACGWFAIYATDYNESSNYSIWSLSTYSGRQLFFIALAFVFIFIIFILDIHFFNNIAYSLYALVLVVLLGVAFLGKEVGGNKAWIELGRFGIQPSELAKLSTALTLSRYIGSVNFRMSSFWTQVTLFLIISLPAAIIVLQHDLGTAFVFSAFVFMLYREGMSPTLLIVGLSVILTFILTLVFRNQLYLYGGIFIIWIVLLFLNRKERKQIIAITLWAFFLILIIQSVDYAMDHVFRPHQRSRILSLISPTSDPKGAGWNVTQSKIAIGSGGLWGKGFSKGTQTKLDFVPEQTTDFIFCTIGEEHGWVGSSIIILLFTLFLLRIFFLAERQKTHFIRAYGYCVLTILFFHYAINVGMTIGLFPVIGIPLPFFSYGGSSLLGFTGLVFILLKLDAHRGQMLQRL